MDMKQATLTLSFVPAKDNNFRRRLAPRHSFYVREVSTENPLGIICPQRADSRTDPMPELGKLAMAAALEGATPIALAPGYWGYAVEASLSAAQDRKRHATPEGCGLIVREPIQPSDKLPEAMAKVVGLGKLEKSPVGAHGYDEKV